MLDLHAHAFLALLEEDGLRAQLPQLLHAGRRQLDDAAGPGDDV